VGEAWPDRYATGRTEAELFSQFVDPSLARSQDVTGTFAWLGWPRASAGYAEEYPTASKKRASRQEFRDGVECGIISVKRNR
jgi:hypothetical protein